MNRVRNLLPIVAVMYQGALSDASAQSILLDREGEKGVVVWKSERASQEGSILRQAGVGADLILPYVACIVAPRTSAVVLTDEGYFKTIVVSDGANRGCRGVVSPGDVGH